MNKDKSGSLQQQYIFESEKLNLAKQKLVAPELEYQKYLKEKQDWEKLLEDITGTPEQEGSIKNLQSRINYIDHTLNVELARKIEIRRKFVEDLMQKKHQVLETYNTLFAPIVQFINDYREELRDYPIEFDSTFTIRNFGDKFFDFVSQQASGSYYGKEQGQARIMSNIDGVDMADIWKTQGSSAPGFSSITNMYLTHKYTIVQMMHVSGHKTQKTFMDYIKLSSDEIADEIDAIANPTKADVF